jgi:hypothetical protein
MEIEKAPNKQDEILGFSCQEFFAFKLGIAKILI